MRGLTPTPRPAQRHEDGAVAVLIALMLVVFVAMVALAVDVGGLYLRRRELVNGSDAAALSAGRTCARGGSDDRFIAPEDAADFQVQENARITGLEVAGTNITSMTGCGEQWGHVSVEYTSQQDLFFAPAIGFENSKPVTTEATASWGLGSNNPVPIVVSSLLSVNCPIPPNGSPAIGQTCSFWYDNDRLEGGNFAFLSLNPNGWDVPIDDNCSGAQAGGTSTLTGWIDGSIPASVPLNFTEPTYVCSDSGIRGVGGSGGPNSQLWKSLADLEGQTRDFPINWEGPGAPVFGAPEQGTVYQNSQIHKYDIIGFAFLTIVDVVSVMDADGGVGNCHTKNNSPVVWNTVDQTLDLDTITSSNGDWQGCPGSIPDAITSMSVTQAKNNDPPCCQVGVDFTYDDQTHVITWIGAVPKNTAVQFDWLIDPNNGPCGTLPPNSSAMCVVTSWQGSTLDDDFPAGTDKNTVVRLCDFSYGTCLDQ
ncbi:MAG TPA: pilus assembly protein TadG-related protein [Actinomycetota bacterium]|nr:pilus assembly protein TadG-related protein [Actinomycetota bacterium]